MIKKLETYNFHDSILIRFDIDFNIKIFGIVFQEEFESDIIKLEFRNISELKIDSLLDYDDFEIHEANFYFKDGKYRADFIMLLGFEKPSWQISFVFETVDEVMGNVSN